MAVVVAGLDGFKKQWMCIVLRDGMFDSARVFPSLEAAAKALSEAAVIAVDTPMGFAVGYGRRAEHEARVFIGPRRSSVFLTLPRVVYEAETYAQALAEAKILTDKGLNKQSFGLRHKMFEAQRAVEKNPRMFEVHPEVSFRELAGAPLAYSKTTWAGLVLRRRLLGDACIEIPDDLAASVSAGAKADPGRAAPDDVLDAAVAAWTAHRKANNKALRLPAGADVDPSEGAIWY